MSDLDPGILERIASDIGMDLTEFQRKYLTDAPFHGLAYRLWETETENAQRREALVFTIRKVYQCGDLNWTAEEKVAWDKAKAIVGIFDYKAGQE